jgi:hypothetical protein
MRSADSKLVFGVAVTVAEPTLPNGTVTAAGVATGGVGAVMVGTEDAAGAATISGAGGGGAAAAGVDGTAEDEKAGGAAVAAGAAGA